MLERPRLRPVRHTVVEIDGEEQHVLADPSGYVEESVALSLGAAVLAQHFDGTRTIAEVIVDAHAAYGIRTTKPVVAELVAGLDAAGFLDSPGFEITRRAANGDYRRAGVRPARFSGESYPSDADALTKELDDRFSRVRGEDPPRARPATPLGVIAPHVDLRVAESTYALAYAPFARGAPPPDLFVAFGTCHALSTVPYVVSSIAYDTPLGVVPTDAQSVSALAARAAWDVFADEALHRAEHSLEFQALHLRYLFGNATPPMIAVLTGATDTDGTGDVSLAFLEAVRDVAAQGGRRACYIAGADLTHMGPRFDDPEPLDATALSDLDQRDRETLAALTLGDVDAFQRSVTCDGNARRICGLSPITAVMHCTGARPATLEGYHQWVQDGSVVSFAALTIGA